MNPLWWWQLRRLLIRLDIDVVNAHAPVPGLADVAAFRSPVPVVMTYHSGSLVKGDHPVDVLLRAYERHVLPRVFDRCTDLDRRLACVDGARDRPRPAGPAGRGHTTSSPRRPTRGTA